MGCCNGKEEQLYNVNFSPKNDRLSRIQSSFFDKETLDHSQSLFKYKSFCPENKKEFSPFRSHRNSFVQNPIFTSNAANQSPYENIITFNNVGGNENAFKETKSKIASVKKMYNHFDNPLYKSQEVLDTYTKVKRGLIQTSHTQSQNQTRSYNIQDNSKFIKENDNLSESNANTFLFKSSSYKNVLSNNKSSHFFIEDSVHTNIKYEQSLFASENFSIMMDKENIFAKHEGSFIDQDLATVKEKEISINNFELSNNNINDSLNSSRDSGNIDDNDDDNNVMSKYKVKAHISNGNTSNNGKIIVKTSLNNNNYNKNNTIKIIKRENGSIKSSERKTNQTVNVRRINEISPVRVDKNNNINNNTNISQTNSFKNNNNYNDTNKKRTNKNYSTVSSVDSSSIKKNTSRRQSGTSSNKANVKKDSQSQSNYQTNIYLNLKNDFLSNFTGVGNIGNIGNTQSISQDNSSLNNNPQNKSSTAANLPLFTKLPGNGSKLSLGKYGHLFGDVVGTEQNSSRGIKSPNSDIGGDMTLMKNRACSNINNSFAFVNKPLGHNIPETRGNTRYNNNY